MAAAAGAPVDYEHVHRALKGIIEGLVKDMSKVS